MTLLVSMLLLTLLYQVRLTFIFHSLELDLFFTCYIKSGSDFSNITGFDAQDLSEDAPDDYQGLDASAAHIANLLSTEPSDSKFLLETIDHAFVCSYKILIKRNSKCTYFCSCLIFSLIQSHGICLQHLPKIAFLPIQQTSLFYHFLYAWNKSIKWICICEIRYYVTVKLGIGGFSMGAATALYSATCHILGQYANGSPYPINLSSVIGLSGWLPCSRYIN